MSATALASSPLGTALGIKLMRTGSVIVQATPVIRVKTKICQTCKYGDQTKPPKITAVAINTH